MPKFANALIDPIFVPTALRVSAIVGSILFVINHGNAILEDKMTKQRLISGLITYLVPYCVSIHGQSSRNSKLQQSLKK